MIAAASAAVVTCRASTVVFIYSQHQMCIQFVCFNLRASFFFVVACFVLLPSSESECLCWNSWMNEFYSDTILHLVEIYFFFFFLTLFCFSASLSLETLKRTFDMKIWKLQLLMSCVLIWLVLFFCCLVLFLQQAFLINKICVVWVENVIWCIISMDEVPINLCSVSLDWKAYVLFFIFFFET